MKKVVVTGIGIVSALGTEFIEIKKNIFSGKDFSSNFLEQKVIPIKEFNPKPILGRMKELRYVNKGTKFGVCAAELAIEDSGLKADDLADASLFIGTGPNFDFTDDFPLNSRDTLDHDQLQALFILKYLPNTMTSMISKRWKIHGETATIGNACAASTQAIGEGFLRIKYGRSKIAIVGGGDSRIHEGGLLAYKKASALHKDDSDYVPFSKKRSGFVPGEGAAFLILEEKESALKRGAKIYGEICGFGSAMDAHALTAPDPSGLGAEKALRQALNESCVKEIDTIFSHGTGTPLNDEMEANLIERSFNTNPFVTSLKSYFGHLSASCGAMESAISLILDNDVPKVKNLIDPEFDLNYYKTKRKKNWIVQNFGFGGQNAILVFKK